MKTPSNDVKTSYFSEAELRVVELLVRGYSEKEIAGKLCLSPHTVNNHMRNIRERYNLNKNTEIFLLYLAHLNKRKFSLRLIREVGISVILILVNICDYTRITM